MGNKKPKGVDIPALWKTTRINTSINECVKVFGPGSNSLILLANTAFQCLLHASKHGDVTLCQRLYEGLGGSAKGGKSYAAIRVEALKKYFASFGPITSSKGVWHIKDGVDWRDASKWDLVTAVSKSFWEFEAEKVTEVTFESMLKMLENMPKRIDSAAEKGHFKGDSAVAKAFFNNVVSFAAEQARRLTPAQTGKKDKNLDVVQAAISGKMPKTQVN